MVAWALSLSKTQVSMLASAVVNEFHLTGKTCPTIACTASRWALVMALSKYITAQSIWPLVKSPPRSFASQNFDAVELDAAVVPAVDLVGEVGAAEVLRRRRSWW